jgi:hypothetical protein
VLIDPSSIQLQLRLRRWQLSFYFLHFFICFSQPLLTHFVWQVAYHYHVIAVSSSQVLLLLLWLLLILPLFISLLLRLMLWLELPFESFVDRQLF